MTGLNGGITPISGTNMGFNGRNRTSADAASHAGRWNTGGAMPSKLNIIGDVKFVLYFFIFMFSLPFIAGFLIIRVLVSHNDELILEDDILAALIFMFFMWLLVVI